MLKQIFFEWTKGMMIGAAVLLLLGMIALTGCPEAQNMMQPVVSEPADTTPPPAMVGEMKKPEETPVTEPEEEPAPEPEIPIVPAEEIEVEVAYYNDEALTDNLAAALSADVWDPTFNHFSPGETVYATATFSHPLQVVEQANPALFMTLNSEEVARFTPTSDTLTAGTYREEEGENRYICKYTVPDGAFGILRLVVEIGERTMTNDRYPLQAVLSFACAVDAATTESAETARGGAADFIGRVLTPRQDPRAIPLEGVRVTVMAGPKTGESTVTNRDGEFVFLNVAEDELHVHLEKACYETKEMLVYRSRPSALSDGTVLRYRQSYSHRNTPGTILMGQIWPEPVRPLLEQMTLPHDLLYFSESLDGFANYYREDGVVAIQSSVTVSARIDELLIVLAHELFHAHQHATVSIDGSGDIYDWVHTPDGLTYVEAQKKDWKEFGKTDADIYPSRPNLIEYSANIIGVFLWSNIASDADRVRREAMPNYQDLKNKAPNRLKWAQEWYEKEKVKRN